MPAAVNTGISKTFRPPSLEGRRILLVAGEASGDQHGAHLVSELKKRDGTLAFQGIGGPQMAAAGVQLGMDASRLAVVGLTEVLSKLPVIMRGLRIVSRIMDHWRPDLVILIDYPDFNFRVAAMAKRREIPVLYYVSPQIWAWRTGRVNKIKRLVDHMAVILPFEPPFYQRHGIPVTYVGHPLLDHHPSPSTSPVQTSAVENGAVVGLLPGSRNGEIARHLPVMLEAARIIDRNTPGVRFILPMAPTASREKIKALIAPFRRDIDIRLDTKGMAPVLDRCRAAVVASGTATLETALAGVPMVIVYKLSPLTYLLGRKLIQVDHIGLVNLIAQERIAVELIQDGASPDTIAREINLLLPDSRHRHRVQAKLGKVRQRLGTAGAARRVAQLALNLLPAN